MYARSVFRALVAGAAGLTLAAAHPGADRAPGRTAAEATEPDVLGTLEATVDGTPRTWYVVAGAAADGPYASGVWLDLPDGPMAVFGGLDQAEPDIASFRRGSPDGSEPASLGSYAGSALNMTVPLGGPGRHPVDDASFVQVLLSPDATDLDPAAMFRMVEGVVVVEEAGTVDGLAHARGTVSGRLERGADGATRAFTDGRFDVRGVPAAAAIQPGG